MGRYRKKPKGKRINPTLWLFCEGETEKAYINFLKSLFRMPSIQIQSRVSGNDINRRFIDNYKKGKATHEKDIDYVMYDLDVDGILSRLQLIKDVVILASYAS